MPASFRIPALKQHLRQLSLSASCLLLLGLGAAVLPPDASAQASLLATRRQPA